MSTTNSTDDIIGELAKLEVLCTCQHHQEPMPPNDEMPKEKCCPCWLFAGTGKQPRFPWTRVVCDMSHWTYLAGKYRHGVKDCLEWREAELSEIDLEDVLKPLFNLRGNGQEAITIGKVRHPEGKKEKKYYASMDWILSPHYGDTPKEAAMAALLASVKEEA